EEQQRETASLRSDVNEQMRALAQIVEQMQTRNDAQLDKTRSTIDQRVGEAESRQTRRLDDLASGIDGLVQAAARPVMQQMRDEQAAIAHKVEMLDTNLRKFDEQAARMVTYFNDVSQQMEARQDELSESLKVDIASRLDTIQKLVEDNDSTIRRFQNDVSQSTSQKINDAEDRFNNRLLAAESRMKEDAGQKIADIDAHVGRVAAGLEETMIVINDRIAAIDTRFTVTDRRIDDLAESVRGVDSNAIDELKDKMSSAVGEAMLVRIEMERLEKNVAERTDGLAIRMTEVETQVQDATMDVSTAIQLERLEEIERALSELDPDQFVRKDGAGGGSPKNAMKFAPPSADGLTDGVSAPAPGIVPGT
ncbi:MAG: hypothetical protein R2705_24905, partial [Ilumatobacteraceae bacterium]